MTWLKLSWAQETPNTLFSDALAGREAIVLPRDFPLLGKDMLVCGAEQELARHMHRVRSREVLQKRRVNPVEWRVFVIVCPLRQWTLEWHSHTPHFSWPVGDVNFVWIFFFRWDISVICLTVVLKLAVTVFTSLYFQTFWPKLLNFFQPFRKHFGLWPKKTGCLSVALVEMTFLPSRVRISHEKPQQNYLPLDESKSAHGSDIRKWSR